MKTGRKKTGNFYEPTWPPCHVAADQEFTRIGGLPLIKISAKIESGGEWRLVMKAAFFKFFLQWTVTFSPN